MDVMMIVPSPTSAIRPSLASSVKWTLVGNVFLSACQWGVLVVLAKLGSTEAVGLFAMADALAWPLFTFAALELRSIQVTDAAREYSFGDYFAVRLTTTALAFLGLMIVSLVTGHRGELLWILVAWGMARSFTSVSDIIYGLLQQNERFAVIARLQIATGLVSLAVLAGTLIVTQNTLAALFAVAAARAMTLVILDVPTGWRLIAAQTANRRDESKLRQRWLLVCTAFPLGLAVVVGMARETVPRLLLAHRAGTADLGVFAALTALSLAGALVANALSQAISPRMAALFQQGDLRAFTSILTKSIAISATAGIAAASILGIFGRQLLTALYTHQYAPYTTALFLLALSTMLRLVAAILAGSLRHMRQFHLVLPLNAINAALSVTIGYPLISTFGLTGAAWTVLLTSLIETLLLGSVVTTLLLRHPTGSLAFTMARR